jgi:hypothetical protein
MSSKHLVNDPKTIVIDSLKGLTALNPNIKLNESQKGKLPSPQSIQPRS